MGELRVRKIQEFIKQEVSKMLLNELKDPRIGFVTASPATCAMPRSTSASSAATKPSRKR